MRQILHCLASLQSEWKILIMWHCTHIFYLLCIKIEASKCQNALFSFFFPKTLIFRLCNSDSHMVFCDTFIISVVLHWTFSVVYQCPLCTQGLSCALSFIASSAKGGNAGHNPSCHTQVAPFKHSWWHTQRKFLETGFLLAHLTWLPSVEHCLFIFDFS